MSLQSSNQVWWNRQETNAHSAPVEDTGVYENLTFLVQVKKGLSQYKLCFKALLTEHQR
jgi:hypothetical protein